MNNFKFSRLENIMLCNVIDMHHKLSMIDDTLQVAMFGQQIQDSHLIASSQYEIDSVKAYLESIGVKNPMPATKEIYALYEKGRYDEIINRLEKHVRKELKL